ncbi:hypothetical protein RSSM_05419 [Rhodopirellula sallentina SM41]|uniref:Uncharacterized protein n=1 Tax=Rhodopirellula sallentina SM41 TaxID=1263870 RepID=M5TVC0_9BACT|nr:hypothetical protein RSSM_05419 [Rhodopirellula sallentina SM41]
MDRARLLAPPKPIITNIRVNHLAINLSACRQGVTSVMVFSGTSCPNRSLAYP